MSADANGKETVLVTLDHFAAWALEQIYRDGVHCNDVETRFLREQFRIIANAAITQAAQHIVAKFGPGWQGVAQEILRLRTREADAVTFGETGPVATGQTAVFPCSPGDPFYQPGSSPEPEGTS